jgi:hypothetical protein
MSQQTGSSGDASTLTGNPRIEGGPPMKFSSSLAVALSALLSLSAGCSDGSDALQPEPPATVATVAAVRLEIVPGSMVTGDTILGWSSLKLSAMALDTRGNLMPQQTFTWRSSNDAVATVSDGLVTAKAHGDAVISATTAGKTGEMQVFVFKPGDGDDCKGCWDY